MAGWNFADVYEAVAAKAPDRPCQIQGERVITWAEFDARANALAADMLAAGLSHQSKVAAYLYNGPEYLETYIAAFKGGFAPVNTNYRYGHDEIVYLFDNADAEAVVFHATFIDLVEHVRHELPKVKRWYCVADGSGPCPDWALDYETVVSAPVQGPVRGPWGRSGDDLLLLYTGGTTGMPKGVMWRQDDLFNVLGAGGNAVLGIGPAASIDELVERIDPSAPGFVLLSACPLMHGTGQFSSLIAMNLGGAIVTLPSRHFDVAELLHEVERNRVNSIIIVGQAFAGPILEHLDANPNTYDLSSVIMMSSSGVMWSQDNKEGLLRHLPQAALFDSFGSSEAVGMGASVSTAGGTSQTARFMLGPACQVFTEDGRRVAPGSGERGLVAVGGFIPMGYYKDDVKTAQTFRTFEDRRWSVPGDWAEVNEDGTLLLLGRGSVCINTGGEKVFPEEVEEALKRHPEVRDAVVVGIPDNRFGETICAVVEAVPGAAPELPSLADHVKEHLAHYKAPRHLVLVDTIGRAPNGKVDYKRLKGVAIERLGVN
ncbi:MAG TPA: acyl-CoA synthetase [Acidimicrobiaceae bacterium]|nr:acyl-CoA synthetase [Acidimicrobiaceae bacterium]